MAKNRTTRPRGRREIPVSPTAWAILNDAPLPKTHNAIEEFTLWGSQSKTREEMWQKHGELVLAEYTLKHPCSRPSSWWWYSAPEPRQRLGGTGELHNGFVPLFNKGIPMYFAANTLDPTDPLIFESEAAYLQRHGLLTDNEQMWLKTHKTALKPTKEDV